MLTFLLLSLFAFVAFGLTGALALPLLAIAAVVWLVTLPFRLLFGLVFGVLGGLFRLVFGIGGALIGIILFPLVIVVAGIALVGAFVAAMLALLTPLIPVVLLALLGWGMYRASRPRTSGLAQP
jgi:hypothetical protein